MKKISNIAIIIFISAIMYYALSLRQAEAPTVREIPAGQKISDDNVAIPNKTAEVGDSKITPEVQPPLPRAGERVTKKPFGIFVTPQNSPVQPEKFRGYHTGVDLEVFAEELDTAVEVAAICAGEIKAKRAASGYGGVVVQACELGTESVTVIYGHLQLASVGKKIGEYVAAGEIIGRLGRGFSPETGGERKHLHLGVHKGTAVNILGYVQVESDLAGWRNPCPAACR